MANASLNGNGSSAERNLEQEKKIDLEGQEGTVQKAAFIYREDVVAKKSDPSIQGIVLEVAGDYDSDGTSTDGTDVDEEEDINEKQTGSGDGDVDGLANGFAAGSHESLPDNTLRVTWSDGTETTEDINDVFVVDRSFLHGDIAASAANPTGQMGLILNANITVDLQSENGDVIKGVSSRDLRRIREFTLGDYVVYGPWLGRVDEVFDNVTVSFDDGSVCKVLRADPLRLKSATRPILADTSSPYYPGQRVKAVSSSVFKQGNRNAVWIHGNWKASRLEGTVTKVETTAVIVYWIASAHFDANQTSTPPEELSAKDLSLLSCFSHSNWQLGDWCFLPSSSHSEVPFNNTGTRVPVDEHSESNYISISEGLSDHDTDMITQSSSLKSEESDSSVLNETSSETNTSAPAVSKESSHDSLSNYRKKMRKLVVKRHKKPQKREEGFDRAFMIVNTISTVDVAWQDGTRECGVASTSLIPIHSQNDHEFFPDQYVVEKISTEDDFTETKRVGIVEAVNANDRTVSVRWLKNAPKPDEPMEFDSKEIVSAYELDAHPDYDYCFGDVVVRLPSTSDPSGSSIDEIASEIPDNQEESMEPENSSIENDVDNKQLENAAGNELPVNFTSLSWVGNIIDFHDGRIEVMWGDAQVSKVGPHEIYVVGRDDGESLDGSEGADAASWETVDENEMDALDSERDFISENLSGVNNRRDSVTVSSHERSSAGQSGPFSAAIGFVTQLASELFGRGRKGADVPVPNTIDENESEEPQEDLENDDSEESMEHDSNDSTRKHIDAMSTDTARDKSLCVDSSSSTQNSGIEETDGDTYCFKHFDVVQNPLDHHYFEGAVEGVGGRKWVKKVQQEWNILEKNLPDNIYVRVYEDRMDLIRAVIIGASGTPYQDGLFFFDFYLPPEYPQVPPTAYYHSGGLRVNPNLYVDGKVCLSLLNTWTGKGNEVWDPSTSSILQVLVSLQGLVLNEQPYFNEAGYEKQVGTIEGEKNAIPYNENTYLLSLKSMLYLLRRPPMHFEDFVKAHFRRRGLYILKACAAYLDGALIGSLTEDASVTENSKEHPGSVGFKLALEKIMPRLISAFKDVGAKCDQFNQTAHNIEITRES